MWAGGREATRGIVFTTNDEEHTVVYVRHLQLVVHKHMELNLTTKALTENGLFTRLRECSPAFTCSLSHVWGGRRQQSGAQCEWMKQCVCVCQGGRLKLKINRLEVLGQDTEFPLMIMSGISKDQSSAAPWLKVAQLFTHNVFILRYRSHPFTF